MATKQRTRATMDAEAVARLMAAQEQDDVPAEAELEAPLPPPLPVAEPQLPPAIQAPTFDPGKVDGRTLRRTGREPFATRIRPETHEALRRIAYHRGISIAEALEKAVSAFDKMGS